MISECREAGLLHSSREQEIRNRAYEIYLQRGGQFSYELEDWLRAEREDVVRWRRWSGSHKPSRHL